jgi:cobalt-zinc-cadmium efflux system protein
VKRVVEALPMVRAVHDLHVWSLASGRHVASLHVVVEPSCLPQCDALVASVSDALTRSFAIEHTTVQVETTAFRDAGLVHD